MKPKPTIGRHVWFYLCGTPLAAIITHVHKHDLPDVDLVNVAVFSQDGNPMQDPPNPVRLLPAGTVPAADEVCCTWPNVD